LRNAVPPYALNDTVITNAAIAGHGFPFNRVRVDSLRIRSVSSIGYAQRHSNTAHTGDATRRPAADQGRHMPATCLVATLNRFQTLIVAIEMSNAGARRRWDTAEGF
jgi:hypothetical protein